MLTLLEPVQTSIEQITIKQIVEHCELSPKAIIVINKLNFFLKTNEDRAKFLEEFERRELFREVSKQGYAMEKLAREIGSYHYDTVTLDELKRLDQKEALERLFVEPISQWRLRQVGERAIELGLSVIEYIKKLYMHKIHNPKHGFNEAWCLCK